MNFLHNLDDNSHYQMQLIESGKTIDSNSSMISNYSNTNKKSDSAKKFYYKANESDLNNLLPKSLMQDINNLALEDESTIEDIEGRDEKKMIKKIQQSKHQTNKIVNYYLIL